MKFKKIFTLALALCIGICMMSGCKKNEQKEETHTSKKLNVVTTIYPYYDFAKHIAGDKVNISCIVPAGEDIHSFKVDSTVMSEVLKADVLVYNGGESEKWVSDLLKVKKEDAAQIKEISMMQHASEIVGAISEQDDDKKDTQKDTDYDEHLWTAPLCAEKIVSIISDELSEIDSKNAEYYHKNADDYKNELEQLDYDFREVVENGKTKHVVFADRFSLKYLFNEIGLVYSAAYPVCSEYEAPKKQTEAYLEKRIKEEKLPVIFKNEITKSDTAEKIAKKTGAKVETFNTCHTVTEKQFKEGVSYIDLMKDNVSKLKEALK
ncbi:zinc ABC transporter substrate-binding protein [Eubacterium sp. MSJ-13]|uniref:metal ABC transporter substrate-binding protein n=1 Tax=Eubacterium sp. MSJ-13 TaxID=2841513 RepID=UPI001C118D7C|nr:metal ABC transporter substrate-binding protein [Eubacterium sp. MSJ-13]MBU5478163.1 zinc ABC transporter substrate-binding protein [Eubacterium sp. MSJ-13]